MARPTVFKRFPTLRLRLKQSVILAPDAQSGYPALADDFAVLEQELVPRFRELDRAALQAQNQFRLEQVVLILGSVSAVILGALQGTLRDALWPGLAEALVGAVVAVFAVLSRELRAQRRYLTNRVKAERLRGEYFRFLGRVDEYADADRARRLAQRVSEIYRKRDEP
jgi:hypothetical protein